MTVEAIDPNNTLIPDKAEVWLFLAEDVADISTKIPATADADLPALGWGFSGLVDDEKGIPLDPSIEVKKFNAFGHPNYRVKLKRGDLATGFTALEWNSVTRKIILPGSSSNKIGIPKNVQVYILYRFVDEDVTGGSRVWVSLRPAAAELKSVTPIAEGEQSLAAEITLHHTADAAGDVFEVVGGPPFTVVFTLGVGLTAYMVTVNNETTSVLSTLTSAALQTALRALVSIGSSGVTVSGSSGGPLTAVFTVPVSGIAAAGTGGTVGVA